MSDREHRGRQPRERGDAPASGTAALTLYVP